MAYTPIVSSPILNVLVYTHNGGSPVSLSIVLQPCRWFTKNLAGVYTPVSGSPIENVLVLTLVGGSLEIFSKRFTHLKVVHFNFFLKFYIPYGT